MSSHRPAAGSPVSCTPRPTTRCGWLLSERRRIAAASEAILHEAALGRLAAGDLTAARGLAVRAVEMNPLDENHQALMIRLYRLGGDERGAER
uniref:hypothetical protein n=1 Tax=Paractinoplanes polyasparticus TaxID=2856853 RepID=UPI001C84A0FA|nr:hypothetical protein [Actinoplanes polyasparticus]